MADLQLQGFKAYVVKGQLFGQLCDDCNEPLSNVLVRLYRPAASQSDSVLMETVANAKDTFSILTPAQVEARSPDLVTETTTDGDGRFEVKLDPKLYRGGPLEIHVRCETVPRRTSTARVEPVQLTLTTVQPMWRGDDVLTWAYKHELSARFWCAIRQRFHAWTICGKVLDDATGAPVDSLEVRAFDADWLQPDPLGVGRTDATGRFRIDYALEDFQKTIFAGLPFEIAGPDVYFQVLTPSGQIALNEGQSDGRRPGRENRGPCFCVTLRTKGIKVEVPPTVVPLFTNVGQYSVDPVDAAFTPDGLAVDAAGHLAFASVVPLRGLLPSGNDPVAMEYRFRVAPISATGVLGPVSDVTAPMIRETAIGKIEYYDWNGAGWSVRAADVFLNGTASPLRVNQPDGTFLTVNRNVSVAPDGWITVPRVNDPGPGGAGLFVAHDHMANLDTATLTSESHDAIAPAKALAGQPLPAGQTTSGKGFRLFFEARNAATLAPIGGNQLARMTCLNAVWSQERHPSWAGGPAAAGMLLLLDIQELLGAGHGCDRVSGQAHALCTVYHPYLAGVTLSLRGNSPPPAQTVPVAGGTSISPAGGVVFAGLHPCAYILRIDATANITHGYGRPNAAFFADEIAFCAG